MSTDSKRGRNEDDRDEGSGDDLCNEEEDGEDGEEEEEDDDEDVDGLVVHAVAGTGAAAAINTGDRAAPALPPWIRGCTRGALPALSG